ncbi:MAG: hypothetical protein A3J54_01390 [Candidatus Ryanbacteria bacterium RIFCSPHIGHO2_02_FULL_45_13b]|uniref:Uncharacterized protein n=1 Tax=Candidatus Ryanbacteria bacterium RIFCSPHIGHO2_02_FULL_45_13b TaxID=1802117 RepID=A0A1G2GAU1_9BACT|nr:MAG: hypothetical protein A3J54_01390 [Candidatus Ryanbacteria bacterium RIFCSPHIGHO2_02_FULL_45_13b]
MFYTIIVLWVMAIVNLLTAGIMFFYTNLSSSHCVRWWVVARLLLPSFFLIRWATKKQVKMW